ALNIVLEGPVEIPADEQIELAVIVVVEKSGAGTPSGGGHSRLDCHVLECAVAPIPIEDITTVCRQIEIRKSVVVVVTDGDAHPVTGSDSGKSGFFGDVGKFPIAVIPVKPVPVFGVALVQLGAIDPGAVGEEYVEISV